MSKVETAVRDAIVKGVFEAAARPLTATEGRDVNVVTSKVLAEVAPVVAHATNSEPWYRSRVTWGAIASIVLPLLGAFGVSSDIIDADQFVALGLALGTAAGGVLSLYGRWKAKTPIGQ
ncbi:hypothetical protein LH464_21255 [Neorhizobium sp. T786]|uniref:hypothetical protein n=1 Tax=Pseudorhizobium xiangyangii TaxID=2883104 RepID=UPI001CFFEA59|nr:hypothetical protein [Neorhizobium xiangyangii]MCB5204997.1 hypothetical protein [Neorhizobium xiangyangii]